MLTEKLTPPRYFAWQKSVEIGTRLANDHPEIRERYENGITLERIAEEFDVENSYNTSKRVAITSVDYALTLLMPEHQREQLRVLHHQAGAIKRYELYGSSFTKEDCQRGANNLYQRLTKKEKRERSLKAILAKGKTPWNKAEIKSFKRMYSGNKYLIQSGQNYGLPDMKRIVVELNYRFHNGELIRTNKALSTYARKHF